MSDKKTASYTRAAIDKYNLKFDRVAANLPRGTKERITAAAPEVSWGAFVVAATLEKLERIENENKK